MQKLNPDLVPVLPMNGVLNEECVAMGAFDNGIVMLYMERDEAVLITWDEIAAFGKEISKIPIEESGDESVSDTREIVQE